MRFAERARRKGRQLPLQLFVLLAMLAVTVSLSACGETPAGEADTAQSTEAAGATGSTDTSDAGESSEVIEQTFGREWKTDIRLAITRESQLISEADTTQAEWDETVDAMRAEGLKDPISADDLRAAAEDAEVFEDEQGVYQLGPSSLFGKVTDAGEAYRLAFRLIGAVGGNADTCLRLISRINKNDLSVYVFQQFDNGEEVLGASLRIAVDASGEVSAVFSSIDPEASHAQDLCDQEGAEKVAAENSGDAKVLSEYTARGIYQTVDFAEALDLEVDGDPVPSNLVWIVYTANDPDSAEGDYPYLAHYVKADGTYIKSLAVSEPGDEEARCGYRKKDVFKGMDPATYTCDVTDLSGNDRTITIPVMYSKEKDCYYLGDVERRIVVADFYEAAYGKDHTVVPLESKDNTDWDIEDVYTFHNYLRAWDFYADMGWIGPDGQNTDEVIFRGLCYHDRSPYENACSIGRLEAWQAFGYAPYNANGDPLRLSWGLDVMAHEYTHTFTTTVMGQNLYRNDLGAINEAMSDIMGNLVEFICNDTTDTEWKLGENTPYTVRSMSDPNAFAQPAYVWDKFYGPHVSEVSSSNDNGGVHFNSSLFNLICAKLCLDHDMSYEEAVDFWMEVALGLTPKTDYPRSVALLRWAMRECGLDAKYGEGLDELIEQTRIAHVERPETLPAGQKLVVLDLPDNETFKDKGWAILCMQVDASKLVELAGEISGVVANALTQPGGLDELGEGVSQLMDELHIDEQVTGTPVLEMDEPQEGADEDVVPEIFRKLLQMAAGQVSVSQLTSWEEMDTGTMPMIADRDKPSVYVLVHVSHGGAQTDNMVVKVGDSWFDLGKLISDEADVQQKETEELSGALVDAAIETGTSLLGGSTEAVDESGVEHLPTGRLDQVEISEEGMAAVMK